MSTSKVQGHIDSAGRLAAIISDLGPDHITLLDVLLWCDEVNVILANDTKVPHEAYQHMGSEGP